MRSLQSDYHLGKQSPWTGPCTELGKNGKSLNSQALKLDLFQPSQGVDLLASEISSQQDPKKVKSLSCVQLFVTPWTVAFQAPLSMGFSRQEYWNRQPFPSPGDLPDTEIKPGSLALQADSLPSEPPGAPKNFDPKNFDQFGMQISRPMQAHCSLAEGAAYSPREIGVLTPVAHVGPTPSCGPLCLEIMSLTSYKKEAEGKEKVFSGKAHQHFFFLQ